jgi:hypothetical protein
MSIKIMLLVAVLQSAWTGPTPTPGPSPPPAIPISAADRQPLRSFSARTNGVAVAVQLTIANYTRLGAWVNFLFDNASSETMTFTVLTGVSEQIRDPNGRLMTPHEHTRYMMDGGYPIPRGQSLQGLQLADQYDFISPGTYTANITFTLHPLSPSTNAPSGAFRVSTGWFPFVVGGR